MWSRPNSPSDFDLSAEMRRGRTRKLSVHCVFWIAYGILTLSVVVGGCGAFARVGPTPSPSPTSSPSRIPATSVVASAQAVLAVVVTPSPTTSPSSPTVALAPTSSPTPVPFMVGNTNGDGVFIRSEPGGGNRFKAWIDGSPMIVVGPDQTVAGQVWKNVKDPDGNSGWIASQFLVLIPVTDVPATPSVGSTTTVVAAATVTVTTLSPASTSIAPVLLTDTPVPVVTTAPVTVIFVGITGAHPGQNASVSVQTAPRANCDITYVVPRGIVTVVPGLAPKPADASGLVGWSWLIDPATPLGPGVVTVTCGGASATAEVEIF